MWAILGLLIFCSLPTLPQGQPPGVKCVSHISQIEKCFLQKLEKEEILKKHLETMTLLDIQVGLLVKLVELKITAVKLNAYKLITLPDINGVAMTLDIQLDITAKLLGSLELVKISLDLKTSIRYKIINFSGGSYSIDILDCSSVFGDLTVSTLGLLTVSLKATVRESLIGDIGPQICSLMAVVVNLLREAVLASINVVVSLGTYGDLSYKLANLPIVVDGAFQIAANVVIMTGGGSALSIPSTAISINMPTLLNFQLCQALHPEFLNIALFAYLHKTEKVLSLIPGEFSGAVELKAAILDLIPPEHIGSIGTSVLSVKILILDRPAVHLKTKLTLNVSVQIEVYIKKADGSIISVLILKSSLTFATVVSVVKSSLILSLTISSNTLAIVSSGKGIVQVSALVPHCNKMLSELFIPVLNGKLLLGIPLLSISDILVLTDVTVFIRDALVLCV